MEEQNSNDKQLIYETKVLVQTLKERVDRHSIEHSTAMDRIYREIRRVREIVSENFEEERQARSELEKRVAKLETERNIGLKIIVPVISFIFGVVGSFFSGIIRKIKFGE